MPKETWSQDVSVVIRLLVEYYPIIGETTAKLVLFGLLSVVVSNQLRSTLKSTVGITYA